MDHRECRRVPDADACPLSLLVPVPKILRGFFLAAATAAADGTFRSTIKLVPN